MATLAGELMLGAPSVQQLIKHLVPVIDGRTHDGAVADLIGQHRLVDQIAENFRMREWRSIGADGHVAEGVEAELNWDRWLGHPSTNPCQLLM